MLEREGQEMQEAAVSLGRREESVDPAAPLGDSRCSWTTARAPWPSAPPMLTTGAEGR